MIELNKIYNEDCLETLTKLPDKSINCCVTSPPYYGLRDYGVIGQIGLEETPEQYVEKLVVIFREVRRVLKDDGTLWLNLGDSYWGGGWRGAKINDNSGKIQKGTHCGETMPNLKGKNGIYKPKDLIGIPWMVAFALRQPYENHLIKDISDRAYLAGLIDGEGCITILKTKSNHSDSYSYPPIVQIRMCDIESIDLFAELVGVNKSSAELYNSQKNANQRESYNIKATSKKAMDLIADIYPFLRVKKKQAIVAYNHQLYRNKTNYQKRNKEQIEREIYCKKLINKLNQRESVDIPSWMIEPKTQIEQGWYLRQDLIWHKPNPMPESVTDRCTKAHEYIFLLSKSQRYYYDAESIKEPVRDATILRLSQQIEKQKGSTRVPGKTNGNMKAVGPGRNPRKGVDIKGGNQSNSLGIPAMAIHGKWVNGHSGYFSKNGELIGNGKANKKSVWSITTRPYKEAHFATYPEKLIVPCIKAGCQENGIVLDPFMGAGTTALVAHKLNRKFIGSELNPEYVRIAEKRLEPHLMQQKLF